MSALQTVAHATTKYLRESYNEMRSVVWPNRRQVIMHTILVIVFSVLIALFLGALDMIFAFGLEKLIVR